MNKDFDFKTMNIRSVLDIEETFYYHHLIINRTFLIANAAKDYINNIIFFPNLIEFIIRYSELFNSLNNIKRDDILECGHYEVYGRTYRLIQIFYNTAKDIFYIRKSYFKKDLSILDIQIDFLSPRKLSSQSLAKSIEYSIETNRSAKDNFNYCLSPKELASYLFILINLIRPSNFNCGEDGD